MLELAANNVWTTVENGIGKTTAQCRGGYCRTWGNWTKSDIDMFNPCEVESDIGLTWNTLWPPLWWLLLTCTNMLHPVWDLFAGCFSWLIILGFCHPASLVACIPLISFLPSLERCAFPLQNIPYPSGSVLTCSNIWKIPPTIRPCLLLPGRARHSLPIQQKPATVTSLPNPWRHHLQISNFEAKQKINYIQKWKSAHVKIWGLEVQTKHKRWKAKLKGKKAKDSIKHNWSCFHLPR